MINNLVRDMDLIAGQYLQSTVADASLKRTDARGNVFGVRILTQTVEHVRRADHLFDAVFCSNFGHVQRLLKGPRTVVDLRQNM